MRFRTAVAFLVGVLAVGLAWLLAAPVDIDPETWTPGPNPWGTPPWVSNGELSRVTRLSLEGAVGPEDIEVLPDGSLMTGVEDGRLLLLRRGKLRTIADTGGRPLGITRGVDGAFWVADGERGLLRVTLGGEVAVAATAADGIPFGFTDDVDVTADGRVWFTDADHAWGPTRLKEAVLEGRPNGRLLVYDPATSKVSTVADGLHFANGVAVGPDGGYLLLTETLRHRVLKVWLRPDRLGQVEVVLDNLPGYPDNITHAGRGVFWVALFGPRTAFHDAAASSALLRKVAARAPGMVLARTPRHPIAVAVNHLGRVLHVLDDPDGGYAPLTSVTEREGKLYLGSLYEPDMGVATAPIRR